MRCYYELLLSETKVLYMGYGFGMLEFGLKRGWVIIGFMIVAMVLQNFYRINVVLKR